MSKIQKTLIFTTKMYSSKKNKKVNYKYSIVNLNKILNFKTLQKCSFSKFEFPRIVKMVHVKLQQQFQTRQTSIFLFKIYSVLLHFISSFTSSMSSIFYQQFRPFQPKSAVNLAHITSWEPLDSKLGQPSFRCLPPQLLIVTLFPVLDLEPSRI